MIPKNTSDTLNTRPIQTAAKLTIKQVRGLSYRRRTISSTEKATLSPTVLVSFKPNLKQLGKPPHSSTETNSGIQPSTSKY